MMRKIILFLLLVSFTLSACLPTSTSTPEVQTEEVLEDAQPVATEPVPPQTSEVSETSEVLNDPTPTTIGTVTADLGDITDLVVQLLVLFFGTGTGVWLFYIQHNFKGVYWARHAQWDYFKASLQGSSFYKLPAVLQWFSGNIGFHHIHHLGSKIPSYKLPQAYNENPIFHVKPLTLQESLKCLKWRVYDEARHTLADWGVLKQVTATSTGNRNIR